MIDIIEKVVIAMKKIALVLGMTALASIMTGCTFTVQNDDEAYLGDERLVPLTDKDEIKEQKVTALEDRKIYQFDPETQELKIDGFIEKGTSYLRPVNTGDTLMVDGVYYDYVQFGNKMVLIDAIDSTSDLRETMVKE